MVKQCKYVDINRVENRCHDYFISHRPDGDKIMCRLTEWKKKRGMCPYDKTIISPMKHIKRMKERGQQILK